MPTEVEKVARTWSYSSLLNAAVPPRQSPFVRLLPALIWVIGYYLALVANRWAIAEAQIPLVLGFWPSHLLFAATAYQGLRRLNQVPHN